MERGKRATCAVFLVFVSALSIGAASASACVKSGSPKKAEHCYAIVERGGANLGLDSDIRTFFASVPVLSEEFVDHEMWDSWSEPGWVEAGDTEGAIQTGISNGLVYFTAVEYPPSSSIKGYYEADMTYGPGADNWFEDDIHAAGYGEWSIFLGGSNVWNWGTLPGFAYDGQAGLEATDEDIVSSGQMTNLAYWNASTGQLDGGWPGDEGITVGHTCLSVDGDIGGSFENDC